jgi:hypothetical protein
MAQVVEHLPSNCKALSSSPSTTKTKQNQTHLVMAMVRYYHRSHQGRSGHLIKWSKENCGTSCSCFPIRFILRSLSEKWGFFLAFTSYWGRNLGSFSYMFKLDVGFSLASWLITLLRTHEHNPFTLPKEQASSQPGYTRNHLRYLITC